MSYSEKQAKLYEEVVAYRKEKGGTVTEVCAKLGMSKQSYYLVNRDKKGLVAKKRTKQELPVVHVDIKKPHVIEYRSESPKKKMMMVLGDPESLAEFAQRYMEAQNG